MGGGAIKDPKTGASITGRLPAAPYTLVKRYILSQLALRGIHAETVLELPGKLTFGDLDVLYVRTPDTPDMRSVARDVCRLQAPWHVTENGRVMSCAVDWQPLVGDAPAVAAAEGEAYPQFFQVDFIATASPGALDAARFYFSYGDIGPIFGAIARNHSLRLGDEGLWCDVLEHTVNPACEFDVRHTIGKLLLTTDPRAICEYLGVDYGFWECGIAQLPAGEWTEIFRWIEASPLFRRDIFKSLNSDHRARFDKRPFYRQFVEHLGISELTLADASRSESGGSEVNMQPEAIRHFKKLHELEALYATVLADRSRNAKFRGGDIIDAYERVLHKRLTGKAAGAAIASFQWHCLRGAEPAAGTSQHVPSDEWRAFLDTTTREAMQGLVEGYVQAQAVADVANMQA